MPLPHAFGNIDIYLFDQLLRGRLRPGLRVLDSGCGAGRNLTYLLRQGFDVCATDANPDRIAEVRSLAAGLATAPDSRFRVEDVERCSFDDGAFDFVISSAVLHFARDDAHFDAMVSELWRVLSPGGVLFSRLASTIGLDGRLQPLGANRFLLPDGSERYLVTERRLLDATDRLGGTLLDPLKTTLVHDQRSMTTWVVGKSPR